MFKTTKNNLVAKITWVAVFSLLLFFSPLPQRKASAWIDTIIPKVILPPMQALLDQLNYMITGAAKQAAIQMITKNVYSSVSGGSGGTKFIVNWQTSLIDNPKKETALYIEQLSKSSTQMKGSSFYESTSDSTDWANNFEGVGEAGLAQYFRSPRFIDSANAQEEDSDSSEDYPSSLQDIALSVAYQADEDPCAITYEGDPADMFDEGTFENFSEFMSGNNDPWSYQTCMQNVYEETLAEKKEIAAAEAIAYQGFTGTGENGNISYPGILVKEMMANVENMGNEVIVNARGIAEVITSAVMKMGMDAMNNGIGNVQEQVQESATNVSDKSATQTQNQVDNYGPGVLYGN